MSEPGPKLYRELASWWPLLSAPEEYEEEAAFHARVLREATGGEIRHVLELGSGGGSNASHMKRLFRMTLVDLSPGMLEVSRRLNPELAHHEGDMRTVRLGRTFDAVFVHDAIGFMATAEDLRLAMETAFLHCRPGAGVLFAPDHVRENFRPGADCGGHDDGARGLRYLEWTWDPDPDDDTYTVDYAYLLRDRDGSVEVVHDRNIEGLFPREKWLRTMREIGFVDARSLPFVHSEVPRTDLEIFVGRRP